MKIQSAVLEGPRNPGRWLVLRKTAKTPRAGRFPPPRRGPGRRSRLGLLTALDAARHLLARSEALDAVEPVPPPVPRSTPVPPRLGVFNRRPPAWFCGANQKNPPSTDACALDPGVDATAAAQPELRSRLPFTADHRTVHRPQHLHGSSPSTLDSRVPAI